MKYKVITESLTNNGNELKEGDVFEATPSETISFIVHGWVEEYQENSQQASPDTPKEGVGHDNLP